MQGAQIPRNQLSAGPGGNVLIVRRSDQECSATQRNAEVGLFTKPSGLTRYIGNKFIIGNIVRECINHESL